MAVVTPAPNRTAAPRESRALAFARLLRPHQWTKNAFCLAGLVFSGRWAETSACLAALGIFALFSAASSCAYTLNDIGDVERDRAHPRKRRRPLASGLIGKGEAALVAFALGGIALASFPFVEARAYFCLVAYLVLNVAYSNVIKNHALVDVVSIALGFVLRLLAGVYAVAELPTTWITLCTFFLAMFLGFAKRRAELADLAEDAGTQRPVLAKYSLGFLDSAVNSAATMTIITYALFTVSSGKNPALIITVPFVHVAIMYYKLLLADGVGGEEPERILLENRPIQICIGLWLIAYLWVTHSNAQLFK